MMVMDFRLNKTFFFFCEHQFLIIRLLDGHVMICARLLYSDNISSEVKKKYGVVKKLLKVAKPEFRFGHFHKFCDNSSNLSFINMAFYFYVLNTNKVKLGHFGFFGTPVNLKGFMTTSYNCRSNNKDILKHHHYSYPL